jgi:hypothetical protein
MDVPSSLDEISGMQLLEMEGEQYVLAINDSGDGPVLYAFKSGAAVIPYSMITTHVDFEDLGMMKDSNGTPTKLYIADTGDNHHIRSDYKLIEIDLTDLQSNPSKLAFEKIPFSYASSTLGKMHINCEAIIIHEGYCYFFTKNGNREFDGTTSVYRLSVKSNDTTARYLTDIYIGKSRSNSLITAADINSQDQIALLTHDKVIVLSDFDIDFKKYKKKTYQLNHSSQKEAIAYSNDSTVIIADERSIHGGGNIFSFYLNDSFYTASGK